MSNLAAADLPLVLLQPFNYSKTFVKWPPSKRPKIDFQDQLSLNAGQSSKVLVLILFCPPKELCLFDLIVYVPVNNFSAISGRVFQG